MDKEFKNIDEEYSYYSKLYYEKFGRKAFIANPGGTRKKLLKL